MSQPHKPKLPRQALEALEGLNWRLEQGSKHWHLIIDNQLVAVISLGARRNVAGKGRQANLSTAIHIKRWRKENNR